MDIFTLAFPNKSSQQHFTKLKSFEFNKAIVKAKIVSSAYPPVVLARLISTWVKVIEVPDEFREEGFLKHICKMICKPEEVDKESLKKKGPNRVRIKCRDPEMIEFSIEYFFGDNGHFVSFEGEDRKVKGGGDPSDSDPRNDNDRSDDDENNEDDRKGDSDGSAGEFKKTAEEKALRDAMKKGVEKQGQSSSKQGGQSSRAMWACSNSLHGEKSCSDKGSSVVGDRGESAQSQFQTRLVIEWGDSVEGARGMK
jgi:hypothetical protein